MLLVFVNVGLKRMGRENRQGRRPTVGGHRGRNAAPTLLAEPLTPNFERLIDWAGKTVAAAPVGRSDIFVTIRAGRAVYIGPPLAGIAAEMPLLHFHRGRNAVFLNPLRRVFVFLWSGFLTVFFYQGFAWLRWG